MKLVNIPKTYSYRSIVRRLINNCNTVQSWLLYGYNIKDIQNTSLLFARKILQYRSNYHPDLLEITTNNIGIQDVRSMIKFLTETTARGKNKIAIIHHLSNMNYNAQNAMLKLLEDPPKNTIIIIISNNLYDALPTIRSRCCKVYCPSNNASDNINIPQYSKFLQHYNNGQVPEDEFNTDQISLLQILLWRIMLFNLGLTNKEFFTNENKKLKEYTDNIESLYRKWQKILQLEKNRDKFHLMQQHTNVLLFNKNNLRV